MSLLSERQLRDELSAVQAELDVLRKRVFSDEYIAKLERRDRCELGEEELILLDAACRLIERKLVIRMRQRFLGVTAA